MGAELLAHLQSLSAQEKMALADYLWREADAQNGLRLTDNQLKQLDRRAEEALQDSSKRFPLGDAEQKLRR